MKQYSSFIFDSYAFDSEAGTIELRYALDDETFFTETLLLPKDYQLQAPSAQQDAALAALHLIGGISYYKTCLPKKITINDSATSLPAGERPSEGDIRRKPLTQEQADFWNTVYTKGLGEFFFKNQIDFRNLINFPSSPLTPALSPRERVAQSAGRGARLLVPIGGGKDSTVTIELLKRAGYDITLFRIGRHPLIEETAKTAGLPLLTVERHLAPELFKLNAEGALNGHVPITAYLSFLSVVIAELYGFHAVVMSNERSASEGNVDYLGSQINHQWSKSLECERLLRQYMEGIGSGVQYFSLLRPLSELSILKTFSTLPQYFSCITSCNTNWKIASSRLPSSRVPEFPPPPVQGNREIGKAGERNRWCGTCPKCAFAFTLFAAFLPKKTLLEIFGKNLFDAEALQPFFRQLLGLEGFKPFECVGTPEETSAAFLLAQERGDLTDTKAMQIFLQEVKPKIKDAKTLIASVLEPGDEHCIPEQFHSALPSIP
ncbi:MAG TPA: hypothetical protein DEB30_02980 [Candidatus Peribacter riflensis]|uniref:UDP-N-acetyl-alpha-D-muramoyl-L-alanyl-L-glutamate epimerase n=1 Tax=Candidatus Peribacter riflensis TaxID=1735162 RepID=A0A0S1SI55_9BACT|nr:MAG: hypothetical protein PeribacterA2_0608 [Candidatus Peribacter riflensis]OGJ79091.1 MAG: hypothetical protein A2398_00165 [Candidatus Peribacteria bacterium RIFOXYB1_FULL_57_12]OGJ80647.1 MAG: hypothetical protein A2412_03965 [Candidatus Peribacteria bacterium RIFOXYC1_FULL_58_8]ALM11083.1 MAG: hypothetical protein PeribacterB2_0608 [Candidatus Peribacter riflensis]ALM12186.1 MAG: hypothetical protein PeribacterC2_0608 [Candidatus Peribacter riflensis]